MDKHLNVHVYALPRAPYSTEIKSMGQLLEMYVETRGNPTLIGVSLKN